MNNHLPPLKALRAFEAAGRHLSLSKAAEELYVTPGAVSQQVKLLEDFLSTKLFERLHRQIALTDTGRMLLTGISSAFDQILLSLENAKKFDQNKPLTISVAPSFASRWLMPRLRDFNQQYPEIDTRIDTQTQLVDLVHSDIDVGIRFGSGDYSGLQTDFLMCQEVFPVCSPSLIKEEHPLNTPEDLKHYQLLHYDYPQTGTSWPDWQMWLAAAGAHEVDYCRGSQFMEIELLLFAALQGDGVALAGSVSVQGDIDAGRLIKPFELTFQQIPAYYLVSHESKKSEPKIIAFREWLLEQVKVYDTVYGGCMTDPNAENRI